MNFYETQSHFFMVFIAISAMAFATLPSLMNAFSGASDSYIIESMKKTQSEMYFYDIDNGSYKNACIRGKFVLLQNKVLLESGDGVSCTTNKRKTSISLYTTLGSGDIYCVDSLGYQGFVSEKIRPVGRCSK